MTVCREDIQVYDDGGDDISTDSKMSESVS